MKAHQYHSQSGFQRPGLGNAPFAHGQVHSARGFALEPFTATTSAAAGQQLWVNGAQYAPWMNMPPLTVSLQPSHHSSSAPGQPANTQGHVYQRQPQHDDVMHAQQAPLTPMAAPGRPGAAAASFPSPHPWPSPPGRMSGTHNPAPVPAHGQAGPRGAFQGSYDA